MSKKNQKDFFLFAHLIPCTQMCTKNAHRYAFHRLIVNLLVSLLFCLFFFLLSLMSNMKLNLVKKCVTNASLAPACQTIRLLFSSSQRSRVHFAEEDTEPFVFGSVVQ